MLLWHVAVGGVAFAPAHFTGPPQYPPRFASVEMQVSDDAVPKGKVVVQPSAEPMAVASPQAAQTRPEAQ